MEVCLKKFRYLFLVLLFSLSGSLDLVAKTIKVNAGYNKGDTRYNFQIELLELVLSKLNDRSFGIEKKYFSSQDEVEKALATKKLDIAILPNQQKEKNRPIKYIPYPLRRGLLGYRILLLSNSDTTTSKKQSFLDFMRNKKGGFVSSWEDYDIHKNNAMNIKSYASYDKMMADLANGKINFVSRSVLEIADELRKIKKQNPKSDVAIEKYWLIYYPFAEFFYINSNDKILGDELEKAFSKILKDGSWDKLLTKWFAVSFKDLALKKRKLINWENPSIPRTFTKNLKLWYKPEDLYQLKAKAL
jgi:ABC-type amino acid transport substrate-binding protein